MAWDRLDENWRAVAEKNEQYRQKVLGDEVALDQVQRFVYGEYLSLRRQSSSDGGIRIPPDTDPLLERHLLAMDRVFLEERRSSALASVRASSRSLHDTAKKLGITFGQSH